MRWIALFVVLLGVSVAEANIDRNAHENMRYRQIERKVSKEPVIADDCEVIIDGKKATLKDLQPGMNATFTIEDGVIIRIVATTKKN